MKFNKWTVALAAVGVVSLASAAKAEEKTSSVLTALSSTTISGYVDTSMEWNFGTGNANMPPYKFGGSSKADGFNLNVVQIRIEKPLDEQEWAAGYRVDLWAGPDANTLGTQSTLAMGSGDFAVRQAYVVLRTPVGNGLDWKVGVFDSIIGYESIEAGNNPNFTRSYGHTIEPQTHTGLLASYRFCDWFSASVGVANTVNSSINSRATDGSSGVLSGPFRGLMGTSSLASSGDNAYAESYKTYMGSVALTAPDSMGFLSGSTLYGGAVNGYNNSVAGTGAGMPQRNFYVGSTIATPVTGLRFGVAWDYLDLKTQYPTSSGNVEVDGTAWSVAGYLSYQATEKLSFHARCEYFDATLEAPVGRRVDILALTGTVQYDLWKNVISRLELRWDHSPTGQDIFGGTTAGSPTQGNALMLAGNIIYKF
jgi:hypothetical protein